MPIFLYRLRLGWLLGTRFLLLEHRGRRSGLVRRAVIEVVACDPRDGSYIVAAAWGVRSDWVRNVRVEPRVRVTVSTVTFPAIAAQVTRHEAIRHLRSYVDRFPFAFKQLGRFLFGHTGLGADEMAELIVSSIPFVKFTPIRQPPAPAAS